MDRRQVSRIFHNAAAVHLAALRSDGFIATPNEELVAIFSCFALLTAAASEGIDDYALGTLYAHWFRPVGARASWWPDNVRHPKHQEERFMALMFMSHIVLTEGLA